MSSSQVKDKYEEKISVGDQVYTKYRGGSHEGEVLITCSQLLRRDGY